MGRPFPSPGDLPDPGIGSGSPALQADSLPSGPPGKPGDMSIPELLAAVFVDKIPQNIDRQGTCH